MCRTEQAALLLCRGCHLTKMCKIYGKWEWPRLEIVNLDYTPAEKSGIMAYKKVGEWLPERAVV